MKREARLLLDKGICSLIISVDHFNSSRNAGRTTAVILMLHHAFEMLLKASLIQCGGTITTKGKGEGETISFIDCVNRAHSGETRFLSEHQDVTLLEINSLRNAEQHYLVEIPEQKLYLSVQVGFTIFKDMLRDVFDRNLVDCLPKRVLPISTSPIVDIHTIYQDEVAAIRQLLAPGKRQRAKAKARLRSLAIMEKSLQSDPQFPTQKEMNALINDLRKDRSWEETFPNVARIRIEGQSPDLRITKKEGVPVHLVPEGEPHDGIVYRRNDSDYYSMNLSQLCDKLDPQQKITRPKLSAIVWYLDLQTDDECFKEFRYGKSTVHKMYSPKALARIRKALPELDIVEVWNMYKSRNL